MANTASTRYFSAVWRRKMSTAVVKLYPSGNGTIQVRKANDDLVSLEQFFGGHAYMYENTLYPFAILWKDAHKKYNIEIVVHGGWIAGQAWAMRLAIARALVEAQWETRVQLKPYGLLKRDPRVKERKKPGLRKARKSPQWSKR
jgi:small subunit ribosomal protein S9